MDPPPVDPTGISVPNFDEDPEESFIGPEGITNLFQEEESEVADLFTGNDEDYGDYDEYYDEYECYFQ